MSLKEYIPWWGKIAAKLVLSRAPVGYRLWRHLNVFVHGAMDSPEYAYGVVMSHLKRLGWRDLRGKVVLELGPGDSLLSALIARALHAKRVYLVDVGAFANTDINHFLNARKYLEERGLEPPPIDASATIADVLVGCSAEYLTRGLDDFKRIPTGSVDFVFSQAVLEHIRLRELVATLAETRRVMAPTGVASHVVDLKDHLGGALNNLRFSKGVWESEFFARSGFYTNRVRYVEWLDLFRGAACTPEVVAHRRWDSLPTARRKLAEQFRRLPDDDLLVSGFDVIARPD